MKYKRGDSVTIVCNNTPISGVIDTAHNHGSIKEPDWYIELTSKDGSHYWKQSIDGGFIFTTELIRIEQCPKCNSHPFDVTAERLESAEGYIECDRCGHKLYPINDKINEKDFANEELSKLYEDERKAKLLALIKINNLEKELVHLKATLYDIEHIKERD